MSSVPPLPWHQISLMRTLWRLMLALPPLLSPLSRLMPALFHLLLPAKQIMSAPEARSGADRSEAQRLEAPIDRVRGKFEQLPNTGHLEVWLQWLQRISYYPFDPAIPFVEKLCHIVEGEAASLWNSSWVADPGLVAAVDPTRIVNKSRLKALKPIVKRQDFALFAY